MSAAHNAGFSVQLQVQLPVGYLYLLYCGLYMYARALSNKLCGLGRSVANPPSYAFCATALATKADTSLILCRGGSVAPDALSSSVTMRATASAAAINCSSRSLVQRLMRVPRAAGHGSGSSKYSQGWFQCL